MAFQQILLIVLSILLSKSSANPQGFSSVNRQRHSSTLNDQLNQFQPQRSDRESRQFTSESNDFNANFRFNQNSDQDVSDRFNRGRFNQNSRDSSNRDLTTNQNSRQGLNLNQNFGTNLNQIHNQNSRDRFNLIENSRRRFNQNSRSGFNTRTNQNSRLGFNSNLGTNLAGQRVNQQFGRNDISVVRSNQVRSNEVNRGSNRRFNVASRQRFDPNRSTNRQNRLLEQSVLRSLGSRSSTSRGGNLDQDPSTYSFNYEVNDIESNNNFGHQEQREGDRTNGFYFVLLPDGRRMEVTYRVDGDSGYVADVQYV